MSSNPVENLAKKRSNRWYRLLLPLAPIYANPAEHDFQPPLGRWNLYVGGAGSTVAGYVNVDLFPLPGVDVVCDAAWLPFRDAVFERVELDAVLEHTPDPRAILDDIRRCLAAGGCLHVVVPFCHPFHEYPRDYFRFTPDGLKLLVAPLEVVSSGWRTGPTATLLSFVLEYAKLWFKRRAWKRAVHFALGWLLFPLRYLDVWLLRRPDAGQIGNHCFVWARKALGEEKAGEDGVSG